MENITAKVSCFARAYHYKNSTSPIFADTAAEALLGPDYDRIAESMTQGVGFFLPGFNGSPEEGLRLIVDRQLSPSVLGRSAYCERMLENETRLGCRQYVIFASGYDTFAIRNGNAALSVYELDLPEVLADKEQRIENAGLTSRAIYVPCDLSDSSWKDQLINSGYRHDQKSFGSLLGISYYLGKDEFRSLLATWGGMICEGSAICFDYQSREESPETVTCPGQLKFTGYTSGYLPQISRTCSGDSFTTATMEVSCFSASRCISSPRLQTSRKPVSRSNMPLTVAAATSPSEKPAAASGITPRFISTSAEASSVANRQGWVFRVSFSSSSVPSKHCREVPGRMASQAA